MAAYGAAPVPPEVGAAGQEDAERIATAAAERAREAGVQAEALTLRGFPVEEICIAVKNRNPQLLVLGSHGWGALKRLVFGSVSTGVLHHARCPVLVVPGLESELVPDQQLVESAEV